MRKFAGKTWAHCRRGATAIEYGLIVGLIFLVVVGAVQNLGSVVLTNLFEKISGAM